MKNVKLRDILSTIFCVISILGIAVVAVDTTLGSVILLLGLPATFAASLTSVWTARKRNLAGGVRKANIAWLVVSGVVLGGALRFMHLPGVLFYSRRSQNES